MEAWKSGSEEVAKESCELKKDVCVDKKSIPRSMPKKPICTKYVFTLSIYLIRLSFLHSILRAISTKNLQARMQLQSIPLFMHGVQFLKKITSSKIVINSRTPGVHAGGRGCVCAPAFFLYYYHPPHNFFRNMPPLMGLRFAHGYYGDTPHTPIPPYLIVQHGLVTEGIDM